MADPRALPSPRLDADGDASSRWGRFWESPHLTPAQRHRLDALRRRLHDALRAYGKNRGTYSLIHDLHPGTPSTACTSSPTPVSAGPVTRYHYRDHPQFADALWLPLLAPADTGS